MRPTVDALLGLLLLAAASLATAAPQTIYRCGPDGRVLSQTPCRDAAEVKKPDAKASEPKRDLAGKTPKDPPPKANPASAPAKP